MDRPIEKYFPAVLRGVREFEELARTENVEFDRSWEELDRLKENLFVEAADERGVRRFEQMLGIPTVTADGMGVRRFRILSKLNNQMPYSFGWLKNKLTTAFGGEKEYTLERDLTAHTLSVEVDMVHAETLVSLYNDLRKSIPANLILHTNVSSSIRFAQYIGFMVQTADEIYM